jgi:hypothetical protein
MVLQSFGYLREGARLGVLEHLLAALTAADIAWLLEHPETPNLFESGVFYTEEPDGEDDWLDIPACLERHREGRPIDCEDLACWRIAELRVRFGERDAGHSVTVADLPDSTGRLVTTYHIRVKRGSAAGGRIECPSTLLGMK